MRKLIPILLLCIPFITNGQKEGTSIEEIVILSDYIYESNSLYIRGNDDSTFQYSILDMENNHTILTGKLTSIDPMNRIGRYTFNTPEGKPYASGYFNSNIPFRSWSFFDSDGQVIKSLNYSSTIQFLTAFGNVDIGENFVTSAKKAPAFGKKGMKDFLTFIRENAVYPPFSMINGEEGRVVCQFIIDKTGKLINAKIIEGINVDLDIEVIRILSLSPQWKPGKVKGKPVNVMFTLPIHFKITPEIQ